MTHDGVHHKLHILDRDMWVEESCRADDLLGDDFTLLELELRWSR